MANGESIHKATSQEFTKAENNICFYRQSEADVIGAFSATHLI